MGSAVIARSLKSNGESGRITGAVKMTSPIPPIIGQGLGTSPDHKVVGDHTGLTEFEASNQLVGPVVQTYSGWNSIIRVTNLDTSAATVTLRFEQAPGQEPVERLVGSGETLSFDLLDEGFPLEFVGSVSISSDGDGPLVALVERFNATADMLITNPAKPVDQCTTFQVAPLVMNNHNHWYTGISITDVSDTANPVIVRYWTNEGALVQESELTVPAGGMDFLHNPAVLGSGFVGWAFIEAEHPICAVVDEVNHAIGHAMSYHSASYGATIGNDWPGDHDAHLPAWCQEHRDGPDLGRQVGQRRPGPSRRDGSALESERERRAEQGLHASGI
jgi:hypothetical protein